jgi:two-component system, OmpR family, sensor histidine kinase MtrB
MTSGRLLVPARWLRDRWRRSVRWRVVVSSLVVSLTVVLLVGLLIVDQVRRGVLRSQRISAMAEAESGLRYAESTLADVSAQPSRDEIEAALESLTQQLAARGGQAGVFDVVVVERSRSIALATGEVGLAELPDALRSVVLDDRVLARAYSETSSAGRRVPALVIGAPVAAPGGQYEVYFVFSLQNEADTLSLVRRTMLGGGLALALLVAGIAALVVRQVVTPVRVAARTAERFAAGRLEARMRVRGEDEMARLGDAFNDMAANLQQKISELQDLSRVQQRFVADVSHELRTPLTTVRMAADLLHASRLAFPAEVARSAELLQTELDRFEALLSDLLEISRFDAGAAQLETEVVSLSEVARRVADALVPLAARRGSDLLVRVPPGDDVLVEADVRRVERVLRNLVANAIEHGEGMPIEIGVGADEQAAAVVVRDHGVGLGPGEASRVFGRFWRADAARTRHTAGGTGLGLSIAFEDARLHGGWLQAWGAPGAGAAFRLTLPRRAGGDLTSSPLPLEPPVAVTGG